MTAPLASSLHLQGMTELTLLAPLKRGFVPSGDTCSYASRLRLLFATLMAARSRAREQEQGSAFSDAVARVQTIHSFRLAILDASNQLLLAVTFDSGWEPYIRKVWRDLGPLLDLIFCHCEGYPLAADSSFETYGAWIRASQVQSSFFYVATGLTVGDLHYLAEVERIQRDGDAGWLSQPPYLDAEQAVARLRIPHPGDMALQQARLMPAQALARGLEALAGLYALTDFFAATPDPRQRDHLVLLRAAQDLLLELRHPLLRELLAQDPALQAQYRTELAWFSQEPPPSLRQVRPPRRPPAPEALQCGLLAPEPETSHGLLLLLRLKDQTSARRWLAGQLPALARQEGGAGRPLVNLALTLQGLRRLGASPATLALLPREFSEGMEARAGLLGDLRGNHPAQWRRPRRHGEAAAEDPAAVGLAARIDLAEVDLVLQWRVLAAPSDDDHLLGATHPLYGALQALLDEPGLQLLAVEPMRRQTVGAQGQEGRRAVEHFGFVDGLSQPRFTSAPGPRGRDELPLGELLLGHANDRGDADSALAADPVLADGSFLVIRKLRQYPERLQRRLEAEVERLGRQGVHTSVAELKAAMMGRQPSGEPLVARDGPGLNDFDYREDPQGLHCPFQAHIRRANPREGAPNTHCPGGREPVPRLLRRGMSYGPDVAPDELAGLQPARERGLFFMACNASIAEQFEVVQRWISGGNASGVGSAQADPLMGVPRLGERRCFRFNRMRPDGQAQQLRVFLDEEPQPGQGTPEPQPFVQLEWGLYAFVPSLAAIAHLAGLDEAGAQEVPDVEGGHTAAAVPSVQAREGEVLIQQLLGPLKGLGAAGWKQCLEDLVARRQLLPDKIWAAVRELHGGALDTGTEYGVLVGSPALLQTVLQDAERHYSVSGYRRRMTDSIGAIFLGLDEGEDYARLSGPVNRLIAGIGRDEAFRLSRQAITEVLRRWWGEGTAQSGPGGLPARVPVDLRRLCDEVLARLSRHWFGLPDGTHVQAAPRDWAWQADSCARPRCPGHFNTPSRYFFQPLPEGTAAEEQGQRHGRQLLEAVTAWVAQARAQPAGLEGTLSAALFDVMAELSNTELASTCIGVLMGFLPTVDGCWRRALVDSRGDPRLWLARERLLAVDGSDLAQAEEALRPWLDQALLRHPVPDMIWRTVRSEHALGPLPSVAAGRRVVLGLMSGTQVQWQAREAGGESAQSCPADLSLVFGGRRTRGAAHPLHACPGYEAAMGMLLGMSAGLLSAGLQAGSQPQLMWMLAPPPAPPKAKAGKAGRVPRPLTGR